MHSTKENLQVLFEDNHLIIVNKRSGDITQGDKTGDKPLSDVVKEYIKDKYTNYLQAFQITSLGVGAMTEICSLETG